MALTQSGGPLAFLGDVKVGNFSPKEVKERLDKWILTQPPWVEAAAATTYGGFQVGASAGGGASGLHAIATWPSTHHHRASLACRAPSWAA